MKKVAIFRTISYVQHKEVWEKSHIADYDNSKSKENTLEQIFDWTPELRNSSIKSDVVDFAIGIYCKRYFKQYINNKISNKGRYESINIPEKKISLLEVKDINNNGFIFHQTKEKIVFKINFIKKLDIDSIEFDINLVKYVCNIEPYRNSDRCQSIYQYKPLFFLLEKKDFIYFLKQNNYLDKFKIFNSF